MHRGHCRDAAPEVGLGVVGNVLQPDQRLDRLQVVLHPVMDLAQQQLVALQRRCQFAPPRGVALQQLRDPQRGGRQPERRGQGEQQGDRRIVPEQRHRLGSSIDASAMNWCRHRSEAHQALDAVDRGRAAVGPGRRLLQIVGEEDIVAHVERLVGKRVAGHQHAVVAHQTDRRVGAEVQRGPHAGQQRHVEGDDRGAARIFRRAPGGG